jgi:hypothetical protein
MKYTVHGLSGKKYKKMSATQGNFVISGDIDTAESISNSIISANCKSFAKTLKCVTGCRRRYWNKKTRSKNFASLSL